MNLSPYEITLIVGGFTIAGALVGGLIGHWSAINIFNLIVSKKAAAQFIAAFLPEIIFFKDNFLVAEAPPCPDASVAYFMLSAYGRRHAIAFAIFLATLPSKKADRLRKDWEKYQIEIKQLNTKPMPEHEKKKALELTESFLRKYGEYP